MPDARRIALFASAYSVAGAPPGKAPRFGFADRIAAVAGAGLDGLTVHVDDPVFSTRAAQAIADDIAAAGLTIPAVDFLSDWHGSDWRGASRGRLDNALRVAEIVDAPLIHVGADLAGEMPPLADLVGPFREICARAADAGRRIALEPLAWGRVSSLDAALDLIDRAGTGAGTGQAGLVLDVWHLAVCAELPLDSLRALDHSLVSTVQISDGVEMTHPASSELLAATRDRLYPGDGQLDITAFLAALGPALLSSGVTVEVIAPHVDRQPLATSAARAAESGRRSLDMLNQRRERDTRHG